MATRYAVATGAWSALATWDGGASLPAVGDTVVANNFTVTIDQDATVVQVRTLALGAAVSGGGFVLNSGRTLTANVLAGTTSCLTFSATNPAVGTIVGTVTGSSGSGGAVGAVNSSTGTLNITGNVTGGSFHSGAYGVNNASSGVVNITGNLLGGGYNAANNTTAVNNPSSGTVNITGDVTASPSGYGSGVINSSTGTVNVTGNVTGTSMTSGAVNEAPAILNSSTGTVNVTGNVTGGSGSTVTYGIYSATGSRNIVTGALTASAAPAVVSTSPIAYNKLTGPFIDSPVGVSSSFCYRFALARDTVIPATSWKFARAALTVPNYDDYRYMYTAGTSIGNPVAGDVRYATLFGPANELTGSLRVPSPSYVSQGVLIDNTVGTLTASSPDLLVQTTIATLASQTSFTLTAGSADDGAYRNHKVIVTNVAGTKKCVGSCLTYTGGTRTVALAADPSIFTMAVGDGVSIVASDTILSSVKTKTDNLPNDPASANSIAALAAKFLGITSMAQWLGLMAGKQVGNATARTELQATGAGNGTFDEMTDSLESLEAKVNVAGIGTGARTILVTVNNGASVLEGARVRFTKGAEEKVGTTNASGVAEFGLDDGTWNVMITLGGHTFAATTKLVAASGSQTYSMTADSILTSSPGLTTGLATVYDSNGQPAPGVIVACRPVKHPSGVGIIHGGVPRSATSGINGSIQFINLTKGMAYEFQPPRAAHPTPFTVPADAGATVPLPNMLN